MYIVQILYIYVHSILYIYIVYILCKSTSPICTVSGTSSLCPHLWLHLDWPHPTRSAGAPWKNLGLRCSYELSHGDVLQVIILNWFTPSFQSSQRRCWFKVSSLMIALYNCFRIVHTFPRGFSKFQPFCGHAGGQPLAVGPAWCWPETWYVSNGNMTGHLQTWALQITWGAEKLWNLRKF